jgi:uncharacterized OB-fold protein
MTSRPLPRPTELTAGFWEAARRHELVLQRCGQCDEFRHYPQPLCPHCFSAKWTWVPASGRGRVYTFTETHQAFHPAWAGAVPYVVATIELDEGVRVVSDLPDGDRADVRIGAKVEVFFDELPGTDVTLPRFRLVQNAHGGNRS